MKENNDKMFRFLEKYIGKYRIKSEYDLDLEDFPRYEDGTIDEDFDELYIPTKRGIIKHTYRDGVLCIFTEKLGQGRNLYKEIIKKYPKLETEYEEIGTDVLIYFKDEDMGKISKVVMPSTSGAKIPWYSPKNLPKPLYSIPEKDLKKINHFQFNDKFEKMHFFKSASLEFDKEIKDLKGKKFNLEVEKRKTKLKTREFIHSIGLWDDYVKFLNNKYKENKIESKRKAG